MPTRDDGNERRLGPTGSIATRSSRAQATGCGCSPSSCSLSSGLQIFNASPYLDASDKSEPGPARAARSVRPASGVGTTTSSATRSRPRACSVGRRRHGLARRARVSGSITIPGYQDLADGRRWHLFFAWIAARVLARMARFGGSQRNLRELILRPSDMPKLWPMQAYYLSLRKTPPPHGNYNPLQKAAYTVVLFVIAPLVVLTGLALSPGIDAIANPLTVAFGGRQFARLWHFVLMLAASRVFRRSHVPGRNARRRQPNALDDHRLVPARNEAAARSSPPRMSALAGSRPP